MISYLETHIEDACNLKCRGCSHFSGLVKTARPKDLKDFEKEFKRLSEIEEVGIIRLMGGEPLMNPDFMEYVRVARRYFPYSHISLVTNGILQNRLKPYKDELWEMDVDITMSDYHLSKQDQEIPHTVHDKRVMYNISLDLNGTQDADRAFAQCDIHQNSWYFFQDGRLYPCCIAGCIKDFWEHFNLDFGFKQEELGIDIFEHEAAEIEAFLKQPIKLCRFCDTEKRQHSYSMFSRSNGDISEWTI